MTAYIIMIAVGLFLVYLLFDLGVISNGNLNSFFEKWIKKTLWLWLPFYGVWRLTKDVIFKHKKP